ncbi:MAG: invasion associated locus B family protein [Methylobacterium mesophilicum]|nr:invasion associated locus B family protein [Methylobacterium mesophilicum]
MKDRTSVKNSSLPVSVNAIRAGLLGVAALTALAGQAAAQSAKPAPAKPAAAAQPQPVPGTQWFKVCSKQGDNEICNTQYTLIADTRQLITAVNLIDVKGKVTQKVVQAVVPTGRVIGAGVQMQIDSAKAQTMNYSVCFPDRCIAEAQLTDQMIAAMKKGNNLTVTSVNFQRQPNPVKITLSGLGKAYDGQPTQQSDLAKRQQELNDALQKQADARRKKFEDAQAQAKAGGTDAAPAASAQ